MLYIEEGCILFPLNLLRVGSEFVYVYRMFHDLWTLLQEVIS